MTHITDQTTTIGIADQGALLSRIAAWSSDPVEGVREGQEIAVHYHALAQLSTPELARHGLNRQMIARAALTGF